MLHIVLLVKSPVSQNRSHVMMGLHISGNSESHLNAQRMEAE